MKKEVTVFQTTDNVDFIGKFFTRTPKDRLPDALNGYRIIRPQRLVLDPSGFGSFANEEELEQAGYQKVEF